MTQQATATKRPDKGAGIRTASLAHKLLAAHLDGPGDIAGISPGEQIAIHIDQALIQDATGTLVMLVLETLGLERAFTELAVQYVDHNLLQQDERNPEDHLFLESAANRFGLWFSRPGNGVSHPLHMAHFGAPGKTLIGSDSHTPAAGALGMLAFGAGGLDVAMAIAGEPYPLTMPEIWGVRLTGELPDWVSAKDVILELLRRHGVSGGRGRIIEYHGPGLACLSVPDRHVVANMGTELGATSSIFPADQAVKAYLEAHGRGDQWQRQEADPQARYDVEEEIDLSSLEPLIARPSSPGDVVPVREIAGEPIYQAYIGSSANPGYCDFAVAARMVRGRHVANGVSLDINPTSRAVLEALANEGHLADLLHAGARLHQAGCNGCIGMGQAPAIGRNSLRTVPRNFPGRSGTHEDSVFLCSPETATASALTGCITDPRSLDMAAPRRALADVSKADFDMFEKPLPEKQARQVALVKGENIKSIPQFPALPDELDLPVLLKLGDDISTDEIMPAGSRVLPFRSNIAAISRFVFHEVNPAYPDLADQLSDGGGHAVVAGRNYGQGSSREHAALAPRFLGMRAVLALSFARIHRQNLINYGVLPLLLDSEAQLQGIVEGACLRLTALRSAIENSDSITARLGERRTIELGLDLDDRERSVLLAGGLANAYCQKQAA